MKAFTPKHSKLCKLCGKEFIPETRNQQYCKDIHYRPCPVCGKSMVIKYPSKKPTGCSQSCILEIRKQTNLKIFGVENPAKLDSIKQKQAQTCVQRYGVSTPFRMSDFWEKVKQTSIVKYGTDRPVKSKIVQDKLKQVYEHKYHVTTPLNIPHVRAAIKQVYSDPNRVRQIFSKRVKSAKRYIVDDITFDSRYEYDFYRFCKRNDLSVERNIPIQFEYNGSTHTTFVDFRVDGQLFECKGGHLLSGCFDYFKHMIPIEVKLDVYAKNHVILITDYYGESLFKKHNGDVMDSLIGIDIELFRDPKFPYRTDRPTCFYHVGVDGNKSVYEAFCDEQIRWKMIMNRTKYMGGYIDARQVLTALNVTRRYRQPSWFSQSYAKQLISKYCTQSTVVDTFAGWGTRADACKQLHKNYVGIDLNSELVAWHKSHAHNITVGDARTFTYDKSCSVFICPPYYDSINHRCVEDYRFPEFDDECKKLTECEWLSIVMRNIPNASEYVMVCKSVSDEFKPYIVESKTNRSHFGSNNEYVVVVPNKFQQS